jgi:hypothetical protein
LKKQRRTRAGNYNPRPSFLIFAVLLLAGGQPKPLHDTKCRFPVCYAVSLLIVFLREGFAKIEKIMVIGQWLMRKKMHERICANYHFFRIFDAKL